VIVLEGSNDAVQRTDSTEYRFALQKIINVTRAEGKRIVVSTLPPPTGDRVSLLPFTNLYSNIVRDLALVNNIALADVEQRFISACPIMEECSLYNLPEGLHPNGAGYDAISEVMQAALAGN
jgi:lysophospholipase L1-like esterase